VLAGFLNGNRLNDFSTGEDYTGVDSFVLLPQFEKLATEIYTNGIIRIQEELNERAILHYFGLNFQKDGKLSKELFDLMIEFGFEGVDDYN